MCNLFGSLSLEQKIRDPTFLTSLKFYKWISEVGLVVLNRAKETIVILFCYAVLLKEHLEGDRSCLSRTRMLIHLLPPGVTWFLNMTPCLGWKVKRKPLKMGQVGMKTEERCLDSSHLLLLLQALLLNVEAFNVPCFREPSKSLMGGGQSLSYPFRENKYLIQGYKEMLRLEAST